MVRVIPNLWFYDKATNAYYGGVFGEDVYDLYITNMIHVWHSHGDLNAVNTKLADLGMEDLEEDQLRSAVGALAKLNSRDISIDNNTAKISISLSPLADEWVDFGLEKSDNQSFLWKWVKQLIIDNSTFHQQKKLLVDTIADKDHYIQILELMIKESGSLQKLERAKQNNPDLKVSFKPFELTTWERKQQKRKTMDFEEVMNKRKK